MKRRHVVPKLRTYWSLDTDVVESAVVLAGRGHKVLARIFYKHSLFDLDNDAASTWIVHGIIIDSANVGPRLGRSHREEPPNVWYDE